MTIKEILQQCIVEENLVKIPGISIPKKLLIDVKAKLEEIGGEWIADKKGYEFVTDPTPILENFIASLPDENNPETDIKSTNSVNTDTQTDHNDTVLPVFDTYTNFFQQLKAAGHVDITMRIMEKNEQLTISIEPGFKSNIQPIIVKGTALELDEEFFTKIAPGIEEIRGIVSNLQEVKEQAANSKPAAAEKNDLKDCATKTASKKVRPSKKVAPKSKPAATKKTVKAKPAATKSKETKPKPEKKAKPEKIEKPVVEKKDSFVPMFPAE